MTILDEIEVNDIHVLYKVINSGQVSRAYFFMIINENYLDGRFPIHEHHKYPVVAIVESKTGFVYDAIIGGRGFDSIGEVLYGESNSGRTWLDYFDSNFGDVVDLSDKWKSLDQSFEEWIKTQM